jgi:phage shock protein PspC (stress-responsive transcriptional regulator)/signal transduction histidine kinase
VDSGFRARLPARSADDQVVAGVSGGLAAAIGIDAVLVRVAFIVLAVSGPGLPLYLVAWVVMPGDGDGDDETSSVGPEGVEVRKGVGLGLIVLGAVMAARALGAAPPDQIVWPVLLVGAGVGVVVWQIQPQLESTRWDAPRIGVGVVVIGAGIAAFVAGNVSFSVVRNGLLATLLVVGGLGLILGPWIAVLIRDRREEEARRVHADARADMAAHLHDSVLQSLALIQRTDDPRAMATLARQQERELRRWLYGDGSDPAAATLKSAVERVAAITEDRHGVIVETVVVGDAALDGPTEALVAATGEAVTNAAKWSGCERVSVFVETEDDGIHSYVRDTGVGFDPETVAEDRLGVRESIHGRMERVGGMAEITTAAGEGTEVHLFVPSTEG